MPNHFHLLLESTQHGALSELMRRLLTAYTVYYNRRHQRHGHLFQGRFKSYVVDRTDYFLELSRYIHLNPARQENGQDPGTYPGSSFRYYKSGEGPPYLYDLEILSRFPGGREEYVSFVLEGLEDEEERPQISRRRFVGDPDFATRYLKRLESYEMERLNRGKCGELVRKPYQELADAIVSDIAHSFGLNVEQVRAGTRARGRLGRARKLSMAEIRKKLPWTYKEIGEYFHVESEQAVIYNVRSINSEQQ